MSELIDRELIREIADEGSISFSINQDNGIAKIEFSISGAVFSANFSEKTSGYYSFKLKNDSDIMKLVEAINNE